jgi:hypothetical protein
MRSLYLDGTATLSVTAEGPALEVREAGRAARRFPLRRLGRLCVTGSVVITAEAVTACLNRGLVIAFLRPDGGLAGAAWPAHPRVERTADRLEALVGLPNWRSGYENWRRSSERAAVLSVLRQLGCWVEDLRASRVQRALREELQARAGAHRPPGRRAGLGEAEIRRAKQYLDSLAAVRLGGFWHASGCDLAGMAARVPDFRIGEDLAEIAGWQHFADLGRDLATAEAVDALAGPDWRKWLTARAEGRAARDHQRLEKLWHAFLLWMGGAGGHA